MSTRSRILVALCVLVGTVLPGLAAPAPAPMPVETMYADTVSKEVAVRTALADPQAQITALKAVRTVVSDYEAIVRAYPSSGYSDDALWRAGLVSIDAFKKFGDPRDKDAALRLLHALASEYPTSKLARNVPAVLAGFGDPSAPAAKPQPKPAPPPASLATKLSTITAIHRVALPDAVRVTIDLDGETVFHDERIDGPARIFVDFTAAAAAQALKDKTVRFDGDSEPVHQIRIGRQPDDTTRVVLDAIGVSSYSIYPLYNPYRLVIDCVRAPVASPRPAVPVQTTNGARLPVVSTAAKAAARLPLPIRGRLLVPDMVFSLAGAAPTNGALLQSAFASDPADASVTVPPPAAPPAPPPAAAGAPDHNVAGGFSLARQLGLGVSRIVIDPGHGGHDPGAQGKGVSEAELTLDIALRLEKLLQKVPGVEVILTRRTDDFVPLQERTAIANREGADLFLSIHANASSNDLARGVETYYLNFASNMSSAAVAARENAASGQSMNAAPDFIKSIALNNKLDESRDFATDVQRAMIEKLRTGNKTVKDLGVKQAPFMVLIGASMPSVLAEVSFVTNEPEAKLLQGSSYRQKIAEALFTAVRKYQTSLKSVQTVSREP